MLVQSQVYQELNVSWYCSAVALRADKKVLDMPIVKPILLPIINVFQNSRIRHIFKPRIISKDAISAYLSVLQVMLVNIAEKNS